MAGNFNPHCCGQKIIDTAHRRLVRYVTVTEELIFEGLKTSPNDENIEQKN